MQKEIWKDITGYKGLYKISNLGRVLSLKRKFARPYDVVLKESNNSYGYLHVGLSKRGKHKTTMIHTLVGEHFIKKCKRHTQINHIDGNKQNNHFSNLEWCTGKENVQHALKVLKRVFGTKSRYSEHDFKAINTLYSSGKYTLAELGAYYKMSIPNAAKIVRGYNENI